MDIALQESGRRAFDAVIGADGLHSHVRSPCFGSEEEYEFFLGYGVAAFEITGYRPRDEGIYVILPTAAHELARFALRDDRTLILFIFESNFEQVGEHLGIDEIRNLVRSEFAKTGWEAPQILEAMENANDMYFDRMSQIRMPAWHKGRVALVDDAAAAVSLLAGEGTGLALVESYVLAGEIAWAKGDVGAAFSGYEARLREFIDKKQITAQKFSSSFVPKTEFGVWARNQATKIMGIPGIGSLLLGQTLHDDFDLPDYTDLTGHGART